VADDLPAGLTARHPTGADHARVRRAQDEWWGGLGGREGQLQRAFLLPRLFFEHFADTSLVVEDDAGELRGFLIGFLSQSHPGLAYVHFAGVDPSLRRQGIAQALYRRFFGAAAARGAHTVECITSPENRLSQTFHTAIGFAIAPGELVDGVAVQRDHDGPGVDRVVFTRAIP
jgi:ribosomal protein S18 acetylase RimI-like enzyme